MLKTVFRRPTESCPVLDSSAVSDTASVELLMIIVMHCVVLTAWTQGCLAKYQLISSGGFCWLFSLPTFLRHDMILHQCKIPSVSFFSWNMAFIHSHNSISLPAVGLIYWTERVTALSSKFSHNASIVLDWHSWWPQPRVQPKTWVYIALKQHN